MQFADSQTGCCGEDLLYFAASFFSLSLCKRPNSGLTHDTLQISLNLYTLIQI